MDDLSKVLIAAFCGSMFGLPAGFLAIEVIRYVVSNLQDKTGVGDDILEWAVRQPGVKVVSETQVAGNWVRTMDLRDIHTVDEHGQPTPLDTDGLPGLLVTQVIGVARTVGTPPLVPHETEQEARSWHASAVTDVRLKIGLPAS